jgi:hypothetical protein
MATNGQTSDQDQEVFRGIERAITGAGGSKLALQPQADPPPTEDSITAFIELLAEQYRALGRQALEHGQYISQACTEHADKLLSDHRKLASTVLTSERKLVTDAEKFIGTARG